jgi:hypothetical protein
LYKTELECNYVSHKRKVSISRTVVTCSHHCQLPWWCLMKQAELARNK